MITGPSRTADIERVLTIGVHGPERLIIVFVDELGGETNENGIQGIHPRGGQQCQPDRAPWASSPKPTRSTGPRPTRGSTSRRCASRSPSSSPTPPATWTSSGRGRSQQQRRGHGRQGLPDQRPGKVKDYILKVARDNGVKTVVKSKSMATEEIHLNPHLEEAGIAGERDRPGRMDHPAGRTDPVAHGHAGHPHDQGGGGRPLQQGGRRAADLRHPAAGQGRPRRSCAPSSWQPTWASPAATSPWPRPAASCSITNEGNARLVTTLPKIHVALVGIEKLVENFDDVAADPDGPAPQRHGPAAHQLRLHHHRPDAQHRRVA